MKRINNPERELTTFRSLVDGGLYTECEIYDKNELCTANRPFIKIRNAKGEIFFELMERLEMIK